MKTSRGGGGYGLGLSIHSMSVAPSAPPVEIVLFILVNPTIGEWDGNCLFLQMLKVWLTKVPRNIFFL